MFEKTFKKIIMKIMGEFVEDFSEKEIQVNKWSGKVLKEGCNIKKSALDQLSLLLGIPLIIQKGFVERVMINVPWTKLNSKPVDVVVDNLHIVARTSGQY